MKRWSKTKTRVNVLAFGVGAAITALSIYVSPEAKADHMENAAYIMWMCGQIRSNPTVAQVQILSDELQAYHTPKEVAGLLFLAATRMCPDISPIVSAWSIPVDNYLSNDGIFHGTVV